MKLLLCILELIFINLFSMCSEDPDIVFPQKENKGMISGFVEPLGVKTKVYLFKDSLVDSTTNGIGNGYFFFSNVPFGTYKLQFVADSFTTISQIFDLSDNYYSSGITSLERLPSQIGYIIPEGNTTVSYMTKASFPDTMFNLIIGFNNRISVSQLYDLIKVSPTIPFKIIPFSTYNDPTINVAIPSTIFFKQKVVSFNIHGEISTDPSSKAYFDYSFNLYPDTTQLKEAVLRQFFTAPYTSSQFNNLTSNDLVNFTFRKAMDRQSVEKSIHLEPSVSHDFIWTNSSFGEEFGIILLNPLEANSTLAITFDTTMMRKDSVHPEQPLFFTFKATPLSIVSIEPTYTIKQSDQPFKVVFNLSVDSTLFCKAFSITPTVDSLNFVFSNNHKNVEILHKPLKNNTRYTLTVDSLVKALSGEKLLIPFRQSFYTSLTVNRKLNLVSNTTPGDTSGYTNTSQNIQIRFLNTMRTSSVEERCSITPATLVSFAWEGSKILTVKPIQPFKSQTLYTIKFDSGFTTTDNDTGTFFLSYFKTTPIMLKSYSPYNEQINIDPLREVVLEFNTEIDSATLSKFIQFSPPVDSISTIKKGTYFIIQHAPFLRRTEYTFVISDQLPDLYGIKSGKDFKLTFKTAE